MKRRLRLFPRVTALLAGCAALLLACAPSVSSGEEPRRHPAAHVIRIAAELTFDGKPVVIDDLVDCKATYTGTPAPSARASFRPGRHQVATETPDGGMIVFRVSRSFCHLHPEIWGDAEVGAYSPPEGWTPVIEWYDDRDPTLAQTGIIYLSETALTAGNGRLRIVEPFRVTIPEHPASEALIAAAARQAVERDMWRGHTVRYHSQRYLATERTFMGWMLRIPENEWRNPERAEIAIGNSSYHRGDLPDFGELARVLDRALGEATGEDRYVSIGFITEHGSPDAVRTLAALASGRDPGLVDIYESGIPMRDAPRHGILISAGRAEARAGNPFYPDRFDEYVPFTCVEGVMTPSPSTPGLKFWFRERCSHQDHFMGVDFFGVPLETRRIPQLGSLILDRETRDLWWVRQ